MFHHYATKETGKESWDLVSCSTCCSCVPHVVCLS
jgi:hypothetical protein